jgi:hypothetical protein
MKIERENDAKVIWNSFKFMWGISSGLLLEMQLQGKL